MKFELVTLFPEVVESLKIGLLGKAIDSGQVQVSAYSPREHTTDKHRSVDDTPYGGGSGMVLRPQPMVDTLEALDAQRGAPTRKVLLSPQGARFDQRAAERLSGEPCITMICGRYEGFDERIRSFVDEELSVGDFVLLGGESAALCMIEAIARLVPGVIGNMESTHEESHTTGLLEYPHYTRPAEFRGMDVPDVLRSGNHAAIASWRRREAIRRTFERRPDLLETAELSDEERAFVASLQEEKS